MLDFRAYLALSETPSYRCRKGAMSRYPAMPMRAFFSARRGTGGPGVVRDLISPGGCPGR